MTITKIYNPEDTALLEDNKTYNYGIRYKIYAGSFSGTVYSSRSLIKFDLSSLPSDITINSAKVYLRCLSQESYSDYYVNFHRSLVRWFEGTEDTDPPGYNDDGSTYNRRNENDSARLDWVGGYSSGGASGDVWAAAYTDRDLITNTGEWFLWEVKDDIQDFVDGVHTNHGWFVLGDEGQEDTEKGFASEQHDTSSLRPYIEIDYDLVTPSVPSGVSGCCEEMSARRAR